MAALAGKGDQAAEQERDDDADHPDNDCLDEGDAEAEEEGSVTDAQYRNVGGEPGPKQLPRLAAMLRDADRVDAVLLDLERSRGCGWEIDGGFAGGHRNTFPGNLLLALRADRWSVRGTGLRDRPTPVRRHRRGAWQRTRAAGRR